MGAEIGAVLRALQGPLQKMPQQGAF